MIYLTNEYGHIIQRYVYDSFGKIVLQIGNLHNIYTYTGRQWDAKAGLYHYRARAYDPETGRFLQHDPIFAVNPYAYVENNPINMNDPMGENAITDFIDKTLDEHPYVAAAVDTAKDYINIAKETVKQAYKYDLPDSSDKSFARKAANMAAIPGMRSAVGQTVAAGEKIYDDYQRGGTEEVIAGKKQELSDFSGWSDIKDAMDTSRSTGEKIASGIMGGSKVILLGAAVLGGSSSIIGRSSKGAIGEETALTRNGFFEVLSEKPIAGSSRTAQRASANNALYKDLGNDTNFSGSFDETLGQNVMEHMKTGKSGLKNPPGTEWHHPIERPDTMLLLRKEVHRHPKLQNYFHPYQRGGFALMQLQNGTH